VAKVVLRAVQRHTTTRMQMSSPQCDLGSHKDLAQIIPFRSQIQLRRWKWKSRSSPRCLECTTWVDSECLQQQRCLRHIPGVKNRTVNTFFPGPASTHTKSR
jgi:hypothetical protein